MADKRHIGKYIFGYNSSIRDGLCDLRKILYEDAKSDRCDGRMSKISNFENSAWRTDLYRIITSLTSLTHSRCTLAVTVGSAHMIYSGLRDPYISHPRSQ